MYLRNKILVLFVLCFVSVFLYLNFINYRGHTVYYQRKGGGAGTMRFMFQRITISDIYLEFPPNHPPSPTHRPLTV